MLQSQHGLYRLKDHKILVVNVLSRLRQNRLIFFLHALVLHTSSSVRISYFPTLWDSLSFSAVGPRMKDQCALKILTLKVAVRTSVLYAHLLLPLDLTIRPPTLNGGMLGWLMMGKLSVLSREGWRDWQRKKYWLTSDSLKNPDGPLRKLQISRPYCSQFLLLHFPPLKRVGRHSSGLWCLYHLVQVAPGRCILNWRVSMLLFWDPHSDTLLLLDTV